jgi:hypothetical protein
LQCTFAIKKNSQPRPSCSLWRRLKNQR